MGGWEHLLLGRPDGGGRLNRRHFWWRRPPEREKGPEGSVEAVGESQDRRGLGETHGGLAVGAMCDGIQNPFPSPPHADSSGPCLPTVAPLPCPIRRPEGCCSLSGEGQGCHNPKNHHAEVGVAWDFGTWSGPGGLGSRPGYECCAALGPSGPLGASPGPVWGAV